MLFCNFNFMYEFNTRGLHYPKNGYDDRSFKINVRRSVLCQEGFKFENMHFRGPYFTEMINSFGISIC